MPIDIDPAHMTVEQAREYLGIRFEHIWWLIQTGRLNTVRCTFINSKNIIRVWREQVEQLKSEWDVQDAEKRKEFRDLAKSLRKARNGSRKIRSPYTRTASA